ncbi:hypothetical protein IC762_11925 [Bradyrhizobium genosp. L]|uniref:hypothetical protein n=1 Tax=Bradyrhizobium genosp. L TaxID=83637 RepID=UPI0018A31E65|nr:hypothetical protein [Bradyrhizobium genosp. L]QPF86951.1 hypothetical protein IC762_11925 [Bradyrhizobium genosp. L]
MTAASKKVLDQEPGEIEMLLPWHAAGTLNARDARRVEEALAQDPELARQYAVIRDEYAETIGLNESLGAPSARAMQKLFAAIDAEPERKPSMWSRISAGISEFFAKLSPRTLAWSSSAAAIVVLLQAGVIGTVLMQSQPASFQTASLDAPAPERPAPRAQSIQSAPSAPITRDLSGGAAAAAPTRLLVRFAPDAKVADISALLESYHATITESAKDGLFRLQFGNRAMDRDGVTALIARLQREKIVNLAVETP